MFDKNDRRRLYWLIDQYLLGKINEPTFTNEFHDSFVNEMDYKTITESEYNIFSELNDVSARFSEFEEDHKLWPGFTTAKELKEKIIETKEKLKDQSPI